MELQFRHFGTILANKTGASDQNVLCHPASPASFPWLSSPVVTDRARTLCVRVGSVSVRITGRVDAIYGAADRPALQAGSTGTSSERCLLPSTQRTTSKLSFSQPAAGGRDRLSAHRGPDQLSQIGAMATGRRRVGNMKRCIRAITSNKDTVRSPSALLASPSSRSKRQSMACGLSATTSSTNTPDTRSSRNCTCERRSRADDGNADHGYVSKVVTVGHMQLQVFCRAPAPGAAAGAEAAIAIADQQTDATGLDLWNAATRQCIEYLIPRARWLLADKQVLELAAGTGVVGLFTAALGARTVHLTDGEPVVIPLLQRNAATQSAAAHTVVTVGLLRLGDTVFTAPSVTVGAPGDMYDIVIGCELLYFSALAKKLASTLCQLLRPPERRRTVALISHTVRRTVFWNKNAARVETEPDDAVLQEFLELMRSAGLHQKLVAQNVDTREPLHLYAFSSSRSMLRAFQEKRSILGIT
eukprot:SAG31_NODE_2144_length_6341_cov_59.535085_2_plen_472_part_00